MTTAAASSRSSAPRSCFPPPFFGLFFFVVVLFFLAGAVLFLAVLPTDPVPALVCPALARRAPAPPVKRISPASPSGSGFLTRTAALSFAAGACSGLSFFSVLSVFIERARRDAAPDTSPAETSQSGSSKSLSTTMRCGVSGSCTGFCGRRLRRGPVSDMAVTSSFRYSMDIRPPFYNLTAYIILHFKTACKAFLLPIPRQVFQIIKGRSGSPDSFMRQNMTFSIYFTPFF